MTDKKVIDLCPICDSRKIKKLRGVFDLGKKTIPDIEYYLCENCGEKLTDTENEEKIDHYLKKQGSKKKRAA